MSEKANNLSLNSGLFLTIKLSPTVIVTNNSSYLLTNIKLLKYSSVTQQVEPFHESLQNSIDTKLLLD